MSWEPGGHSGSAARHQLSPASVPTGKVFGQTKKWSFFTYCIFISSQLHPTDPRRLLCKVVPALPKMKTVVRCGSCVCGYVITLPMRNFVELVLFSSEPQKHTDLLRHYLEFCNQPVFEPGDANSHLWRTHRALSPPSGKSPPSHLHSNRPGGERKQRRVKRLGPESSQSSSVTPTFMEGWLLKKGAREGPTEFTELRRTAEVTEITATAVACYLSGYTHVQKNLLESHQIMWEDTGHLSAFFP